MRLVISSTEKVHAQVGREGEMLVPSKIFRIFIPSYFFERVAATGDVVHLILSSSTVFSLMLEEARINISKEIKQKRKTGGNSNENFADIERKMKCDRR